MWVKGSVGWGQRSLVHAAAEDDEVARAAPRGKGRQILAANAEAGVLRPPRARGAHAVHGLHRPRALLRLGLSATMPLPLASEGCNADVREYRWRVYGVAAWQQANGAVPCVGEVEEHRDARQGDLPRSWIVLRHAVGV